MVRKKHNKELSDKQRALITEFDQKSPISEQFKTLRTNIQFAAIDRKVKTLMMTSSSPGEGKSTIIANLGVVLAQQQNRVLLVDTDLRKPTVHFTFQLPNHTGLTTVVTQQAKFEDVVLETSIPRLDVLPSGPIPPNPSELLGSKAMEKFVSSLEGSYDYIVFDAPPVNAVTDPQILSRLVDGVILVIRSGKTEDEHALKAVDSLNKVEANIIGAVLNDREMENSQYYYYYGEG
ncbi:CpsD/CapB family tyrosine-protein kinase [Salipaludibacillus agaradhaerens]|uniref:CpsD/CapB family tyrosine-protein kinase n=1 Tax=Salipaludibacillus agaradhaerens TaxID=76935 RepID=UPI002151D1B6|nr:CpsD/CapB family tyrosine-protein kinase [Salipaludibacillus agaradhaerens]MCR6108137.1 CpsD/CapB family tyrosine-protein kinase [Salipaludibacillus agaradhaerens]MCR6120162.1 CpsD/CapB family tyrosine-protein kinase [Salipaludibacillus agaradhaerens]